MYMPQARPYLTNSTVLDNDTHKPTPSKVRTSAGMFFRRGAFAAVGRFQVTLWSARYCTAYRRGRTRLGGASDKGNDAPACCWDAGSLFRTCTPD